MAADRLLGRPQTPEDIWVQQFCALQEPVSFHVEHGRIRKPHPGGAEFYAFIARQLVYDELLIAHQHQLRQKIERNPKRYARRYSRYLDSEKLPWKIIKRQRTFYASHISVMHALEKAGQPFIKEVQDQMEANML